MATAYVFVPGNPSGWEPLAAGSNITLNDSGGVVTIAASGGGGVTSLDSITGAVSLVAGSNVTITDNSPSAGDITIAASGSGSGYTQVDYAQITSPVTVTATTEATAQTVVAGAGFTADGTSNYLVEFCAPGARPPANINGVIRFVLEDTSSVIDGDYALISTPAANALFAPIRAGAYLLPSAGSQKYTIKAYVANEGSSSGLVACGAGGAGNPGPAFTLVTKLA